MMERSIPPRTLRPRGNRGRWALRLLLVLLLGAAGAAGFFLFRVTRKVVTPGTGIRNQVQEVVTATFNPRDAFPGKDKLYVLGLGIDYNYTVRDIPYTKDARSDTIFVASLDLVNKRVGMLSIPRDSRVEIANHRGRDKINAAYAYGGPELSKATVEQFLGVDLDHYLVIKGYGTRNFIDAIGGVEIDVEKDMDYDDNWGHLHIHLKKGLQRLDGEQAVGYVRFRHDSESDFGRMRRQQQMVKAVVRQLMTPSALLQVDHLVDVAMENIITDMSRSQLMALAHLFYNITPDRIHTGSIPGTDLMDNGVWYFDPSDSKKEALVGWLLRGEEWYRNGLVTIRVHNASGVNGASGTVQEILSDQGYHTIVGKTSRTHVDETRIVNLTGKDDAAQQIGRLFAATRIEGPNDEEKPQIGGPDILVYVGKQSARALAGSL